MKLTTHLPLVPRSRMWSYTSPPQYSFMAWCSVKAQGNFTFTLPLPDNVERCVVPSWLNVSENIVFSCHCNIQWCVHCMLIRLTIGSVSCKLVMAAFWCHSDRNLLLQTTLDIVLSCTSVQVLSAPQHLTWVWELILNEFLWTQKFVESYELLVTPCIRELTTVRFLFSV
jgi:hypothetical protein